MMRLILTYLKFNFQSRAYSKFLSYFCHEIHRLNVRQNNAGMTKKEQKFKFTLLGKVGIIYLPTIFAD